MMQSQNTFYSSNSNKNNTIPSIINVNKKVYSRKQLTEWIQKQNSLILKTLNCSIKLGVQSIKNGIFILSILTRIFPDQITVIKSKSNIKPSSQYDFQKNLQLVKKILTKYNVQMIFNTADILKMKNCFQLLNVFKNLYDDNYHEDNNKSQNQKQDKQELKCKISQETIIKKQMTSSQKKIIKPQISSSYKKIKDQISPTKPVSTYLSPGINSGIQTSREPEFIKSHIPAQQKNLDKIKTSLSRPFSTTKSQNPFNKAKSNKQLAQKNLISINNSNTNTFDQIDNDNLSQYSQVVNNQNHININNNSCMKKHNLLNPNLIKNHVINTKNNLSDFDSNIDDSNQLLYQTSLQQNIQMFKKIIHNLKFKLQDLNYQKNQTYLQYIQQLQNAIYQKN